MEMEPSRINVYYYNRKGNYYLQGDGPPSVEKGNCYLHEKLVSGERTSLRRKVTTTHREERHFHRRKVITTYMSNPSQEKGFYYPHGDGTVEDKC